MDAILFHPETSQRRALILALGTYGPEGLSPGEREPLTAKLLGLYRDDPDAGVHGAAAWTLRQWGQKEKLIALDAELSKLKDPGGRRWYVNSQGQTFAVIAGPVEFRMGSPADEPDAPAATTIATSHGHPPPVRDRRERSHGRQFQKFFKTRRHPALQSPDELPRQVQSPNPDGPWIAPDWYTAAHYCNWLSEQEGLPKDQWCYVANEAGEYAEGMTIPADVLLADGLSPTDRCGMGICLPGGYDHQPVLWSLDRPLAAYARYQANSHDHAWAVREPVAQRSGTLRYAWERV